VLGQQWVGLVEWALSWRHGVPGNHRHEVLDFIRYALERSQQWQDRIDNA
jgi:hypothetical protein